MFDNTKYITKGIANELPFELQLYLWNMIAELKPKTKLDYLQVFKLDKVEKKGVIFQQITHSQEVPQYENTVTIRTINPVSNRKVFCIDDNTHSTMLFADEY